MQRRLTICCVGGQRAGGKVSSRVNTSAAFAEELEAKFERIVRVELPNWAPVMRSELTVWTRKVV